MHGYEIDFEVLVEEYQVWNGLELDSLGRS